MTNIFYLYDRFSELNRNFTTGHTKIVKNPGFSGYFSDFCSQFQAFPDFFSKFPKFQVIPGFQVKWQPC